MLDGSGDLLESTVSRADGSYLLTGVPAGSYYVEFSATGTADQTQFYGGTPVLAGASAVTVTAGQTTSGINAALVAATTPEPAVTSTVTSTVTVPAPTSPAAMVGRPAVSAVKLAGVATRRVTLSFRLTAGANAGRLTSVRVSLPKGFSFVAKALKRDLKVSAPDRFTLSQGRLAITLRSPQSAVSVSFKAGAISVTRSIATAARKQRLASARFTLLLTSSSGVRTTLTETVKKPA